MNRITAIINKPRGVHWWISAALVLFGVIMVAAITLQNINSQYLIEHKFWLEMLKSISTEHSARVRDGHSASLSSSGVIRSWYVEDAREEKGQQDIREIEARQKKTEQKPIHHEQVNQTKTSTVPEYLSTLPPGAYSTEGAFGNFTQEESFEGRDTFHALIVDLPPGRLITLIDMRELESQQNSDGVLSLIWAAVLLFIIAGVIAWLHANLVRPVQDLADRMRAINPGTKGARLPTTYKREEIQIIAQASNAHLERVERFIEREQSLLDQASHEFRTPIAVISGAVDVLKQIPLPDSSTPALSRIENAVEDLSETMVALLYLAREASPDSEPVDVTVLHELLPRLLQDHEHLLINKAAQLKQGEMEPTFIAAPEAMVRIAVSNLIRNAIENTDAGFIAVSLNNGIISVADSGSGFNPAEAARRYRDSLRQSAPVRGQGLGLFLIGRICDRFDWKLAIQSAATSGTSATLDISASLIQLQT